MWSPKIKMWSPKLKNVESKRTFGQLILRKIIKTVATRCQILRLKCTKIQNSARALPQTPLGELTALPRPLAGFKGLTSKGRGWNGREREGREGKGKAWEAGFYPGTFWGGNFPPKPRNFPPPKNFWPALIS